MELVNKQIADILKNADNPKSLENLPVLPVKEFFVFPSTIVPVLIGRNNSVKTISEAITEYKFMLIVPQSVNTDEFDSPTAKQLHKVGTLVAISQIIKLPGQLLKVMVSGLDLVNIKKFTTKNGVIYGKYTTNRVELPPKNDTKFIALAKETFDLFQNYSRYEEDLPFEIVKNIQHNEDYLKSFFLMASNIDTSLANKLDLISKPKLFEMYFKLSSLLKYETEVKKYRVQIDEEINEQVQQVQKKYLIKEQIRMLRAELGDDYEDEDNPELEVYAKKIAELNLPEKVHQKAHEELAKLRRTPSLSPDYAVELNYLELLLNLPWNISTEDNLDLENVEKVLHEDHYDLEKPKERILDLIAIMNISQQTKRHIICFVGPPGTGKTSLAKSIARALNRKFERISLGGVKDEAEIRGHRRTYVGALPGKIINAIKKAGSNNPVILLDEIDKMSHSYSGDPASALLEVLDPEQNSNFMDHYLEIEWDLSKVLFITTANVYYDIPTPLLDRMEVIEISSYLDFQKLEIAQRHILPKLFNEFNLKESKITFTNEAILKIINNYTLEPGVRELERQIANILRKIAREYLLNLQNQKSMSIEKLVKSINIKITPDDITKYLKKEKFKDRSDKLVNSIGLVNGLAWTSSGGDLLPVEVTIMTGTEKLTLTGKLGEVMRESAVAGLSYIRSNCEKFNIKPEYFRNKEIHIHIPEGAIPKDGPSAGVTMAIAMLSAITKQMVKGDVAMTGEITLRGNIFPIGGLREKLLAAKKWKIKTVLIPKDNESDLSEIQDYIKEGLQIIPISKFEEAITYSIIRKEKAIIL